jgi:hypothetical protein
MTMETTHTSATRFVALDVHRQYLVVDAVDAQKLCHNWRFFPLDGPRPLDMCEKDPRRTLGCYISPGKIRFHKDLTLTPCHPLY